MPKFKSKPVEIEAVQLATPLTDDTMKWLWAKSKDRNVTIEGDKLSIETIEGTMTASPGDWVICGTEGELYPCKDSVFRAKYEPADALKKARGES